MRKFLLIAPVTGLMLSAFVAEGSAQTATATVTYEVKAVNTVSVSGNPVALIIDTDAEMTSGAADSTTTWAVTTNQTGAKVTGAIDTAMPTNTTLAVSLAAPAVGTSAGSKVLGTLAVDLVTGITQVQSTGLAVAYLFKATPTAGVIASASKTLTLTITGGT
jgi:antitoxin (DNA-binding transcriptional repressor) of toxin-antitoxin stability system